MWILLSMACFSSWFVSAGASLDPSAALHERHLVFLNGGNNSRDESVSVSVVWARSDPLDLILRRLARSFRIVPSDGTPFSPSRPKRPLAHLRRAPKVDMWTEDDDCEDMASWTRRMRLFDARGVQMQSLDVDVVEPLFLVPAGEHFVWAGLWEGRRVELPNVEVEGERVVLETMSLEPRLFAIPKFLSDAEADVLIAHAKESLIESQVFENGKMAQLEARNSKQTWVGCGDEGPAAALVCTLMERIAAISNIPFSHLDMASDALQIVHYDPGQHYHAHHDYFDPTLSPDARLPRMGQQRLFTLFFYLNDVEEGGETVFPRAGPLGVGRGPVYDMSDCSKGIKVRPKKGSAVFWYNLKAPGNQHEAFLDEMTLHGACDVVRGEKWGANLWTYGWKWTPNNTADYFQ